ncbi:neuroguidin [Aplysia californica]|uniref:Neuroguidin n=1 Tax=Aplysia californica TaxID=6500 RepID=A0ABM0K614_APLCA|nr:neuroguidin [Aplysia californica]XP_012944117.1 neuroguidin [Aplysia californica]
MKDIVESDTPQAVSLLKEIKKASGECLQNLRVLTTRIKDSTSTSSANQGISFLDVKNQLMASYMANIGLLMDKKTSGCSVKNDPAIDRLVEIRTVLEKMRPIEHKLRYQINKVVNAYKEGKMDPSDPRKFKANFGSFANVPGGDSSDEDGDKNDDTSDGKSKLYVAPKLAPVHYSDDETAEEKQQKQKAKSARRALGSAMLKEIREQYTDAPVEISESRDVHRIRDNKRDREKTEYEESNFVRLAVSKKESTAMKRLGTMSALGTLADFDGFSGMDGGDEAGPSKKKKKNFPMGKKKKGKGFGKKKGGKKQRR